MKIALIKLKDLIGHKITNNSQLDLHSRILRDFISGLGFCSLDINTGNAVLPVLCTTLNQKD